MSATLHVLVLGQALMALLWVTTPAAVAQGLARDTSSATTVRGDNHIVRMTTGEEVSGRVLKLGPDVLQIQVNGLRREMPLEEVIRVDVEGDSVRNGAIIGAAVLGAWCALVCGQGLNQAPQLILAVAANAGFGALIGAAVDAAHPGRTTIYRKPSGPGTIRRGPRLAVVYRVGF